MSDLYFHSAKNLELALQSAENAIIADPTYGEVSV